MTLGQHGDPEREGYGSTHIADISEAPAEPERPGSLH
jgi:hypothetical protein